MPLLRLKPFKPEKPAKYLKVNDEVFLCDLTGEVFTDYESFYQRMILCNSLVWSCEISGKVNLTYKEALENEKSIRKSISTIPYSLKLGMLYCVHHTRRGRIQDLTDEIYEYFKTRYQMDEKVEVKIVDKWYEGIISELPYSVDIGLQNRLNNHKSTPVNSPSKEKLKAFNTILSSLRSKSPLENKELKPDTSELSYKVLVLNGPRKGETVVLKRKSLRRIKKGVFGKDKVKLFLRETCLRSTPSSDEGYWIVQKKEILKYELGPSCIIKPSISAKSKKAKTVKAYLEQPRDMAQERKKLEEQRLEQEKERERKRLEQEALKEKRILEEKALKEQKLKEKEEEKARKKEEREEEKARQKIEREKERELNLEKKNLELDFVREFNKTREDLLLEDSKQLPLLSSFKTPLDENLIGSAVMVIEFINTFGSLYGLEQEIDVEINLPWLEEALVEHDAEGNYFTILKFLLHSYLRLDKEENKDEDEDEDDNASSSDESAAGDPPETTPAADKFKDTHQKASANASAAAAWSMLHQGLGLSDISIEPFSLTEILRLHILSSGIRIGGVIDAIQWQRRGQCQLNDDPCVNFRHEEQTIMKNIMTCSVYDLNPAEKLKILCLMCDQLLTLSTTREFLEDALDKVRALRKEHRELQFEESGRRKKLQKEKSKQKLADRKKVKEDAKLKKEQKQIDSQNIANQAPSTEETKKDGITENMISECTDPKEELEKELERKRKKEEKDRQMDEFHHEKFLFRERELLKEINEHGVRIHQTPLGTDRYFRRFWKFNHVTGLFVENEDVDFAPSESEEESDVENEVDIVDITETYASASVSKTANIEATPKEQVLKSKESSAMPSIPKVTFDDVINAKQEGVALTRLILNRYGCNYTERSEEFVSKSPALVQLMAKIKTGINTQTSKRIEEHKWSHLSEENEYETVVNSLNVRGLRESNLQTTLINTRTEIIDATQKELEKRANKKTKLVKDQDTNEIDKNLFESMDDYIEGNLRDHLLEIEERLWVGGIGNIKCDDRIRWRTTIEQGMVKLIKYDRNKTNEKSTKDGEDAKTEVKEDECMDTSEENSTNISEEVKEPSEDVSLPVIPSVKAVPQHLKVEASMEESRCSTPVNVPINEKLAVKELAEALLLIERGIERKFLKPPLGDTDEIKKEKLKEMLESANVGSDSKEEDEKKSSTCLSRWEESLKNCISFAQVFIHLDTLDRSILWDKSIQNTKCRLCRRKGNEDEMLLCDGCDRGFHMSCLKPKLKNVPEGDWFCHDCRPIVVKRRNRKLSQRVEDDTEEENESEDDTEEEDSQDSDSQSEGEEEEEEEDDDDVVDEHGERCTICNEEGTLILCDECPRSYHVGCCHPAMKKVPRGDWSCQICTGQDKELHWRNRAVTMEKNRGKQTLESKGKSLKKPRKKQQSKSKPTSEKKRNSSPLVNSKPSKKSKLDHDSSPAVSNRLSGQFRFQLKSCKALINDIFSQEEVEDFLVPVDTEEVPDYLNFIDQPMDFGTIKRKINTAKYVDLQDFLDDINLVFINCETYNPPRSRVYREGAKLKAFVLKRQKELGLEA